MLLKTSRFNVCSILCLLYNLNLLLLSFVTYFFSSKFKFSIIQVLLAFGDLSFTFTEICQVGPETGLCARTRSPTATPGRPRGWIKPTELKFELNWNQRQNNDKKMGSSTSLRSFIILTAFLHGNDLICTYIPYCTSNNQQMNKD